MEIEVEVRTRKKVYVAPCIKCGSDDIDIWDANESAFNYGGGTCKKCGHQVTDNVGCLPKKTEMVGIWNSENALDVVLKKEEKNLESLLKQTAEKRKRIGELKRLIKKTQPPSLQ